MENMFLSMYCICDILKKKKNKIKIHKRYIKERRIEDVRYSYNKKKNFN